jgi:hypothetical protein
MKQPLARYSEVVRVESWYYAGAAGPEAHHSGLIIRSKQPSKPVE